MPCIVPISILGTVSFSLFHVIQSIFTTTGTEILFCKIILQKAGVQRDDILACSFLPAYSSKRIGGCTSFFSSHTDEAFNPFLSLRTTAIFLHKRIVFIYGVKRASGGGLSCSDLRIVRRRKSPSS